MMIYDPLAQDHPLVTGDQLCAACHTPFLPSQRTSLLPIVLSSADTLKRALPVHATCALEGRAYDGATVERVKDGDASPYPVVLDDGRQITIEELLGE